MYKTFDPHSYRLHVGGRIFHDTLSQGQHIVQEEVIQLKQDDKERSAHNVYFKLLARGTKLISRFKTMEKLCSGLTRKNH